MVDRYESNNTDVLLSEGDEFDHLMQMSRALAHHLNNQLTTILSNTQLVILMTKDEDLKPYLKAVEDAARDVGTVVHEYQESSQALAGSFAHKK
jgi:signal transduction histidine kinase